MSDMLLRLRIVNNPGLTDDQIVADCMGDLMARWPQVEGYQWERVGERIIQILMWGDLDTEPIPGKKDGMRP